MSAEMKMLKAALRAEIQAKVAALSPAGRHRSSVAMCGLLRASEPWNAANSVLCFAPLADEPDLWPLVAEALAAGKLVALPRYVSRARGYAACQVQDLSGELTIGKFRVREPLPSCPEVALDRLELVLVPGVVFDLRGRRLGRGRGFYDRLLAEVRGAKCGVAFEEQVVAEVPAAEHDVRMDILLTPRRWVKTET